MSLNELEDHIFAFYLAHGGLELNLSERFCSYRELNLLVGDKVRFAMRRFGGDVTVACENVAGAFVDLLIQQEALSKTENSLGIAYRSDPRTLRAFVKDLHDSNPIVQKAQNGGPDFWQYAFDIVARNSA